MFADQTWISKKKKRRDIARSYNPVLVKYISLFTILVDGTFSWAHNAPIVDDVAWWLIFSKVWDLDERFLAATKQL